MTEFENAANVEANTPIRTPDKPEISGNDIADEIEAKRISQGNPGGEDDVGSDDPPRKPIAMTAERRNELRRNSERMLESAAVSAPYDISPVEVLELLDESQNEMYLRGNQLAAISTVLHANTPITLSQTRLPKDHALYTAAFQDAIVAVEREIKLRNQSLQQRGVINVLADRLARWTGKTVPDEIRKAREVCMEEQAYSDLAASGGIVDAP